jgi:type IV pilus assembly protein PilQ
MPGAPSSRFRLPAGRRRGAAHRVSEPQTALPTGFAVQTPARIALDFPGVTNASGRSLVEINQGNVKSAHIVEAGERSRIVLNLKQATTYRAELQGKAVLVLLDSVTSAARVPAGPSAVFAEGHNADVLPLKDLDFRRGSDGAGRIVVGLANNQVGVDLKPGQGLVVEFQRSSLPEGLRRRLDVSDFGTPVQTITAAQQGDACA